MNSSTCAQLKQNLAFLEKLQVLLVAYFNYGMCQLKLAEADESNQELLRGCEQTFTHA